MRCRHARVALIERELEALGPERGLALERHLVTCKRCSGEERRGMQLSDELTRLRGDVPFDVDVTTRVMTRIEEIGRPVADELPLKQWVLAAAAAVVGAMVIGNSLWDLLPGLIEPARNAVAVLASARGVAASLGAPLVALLGIPFKLLGTLLSSLGGLASLLQRLEPLGVALAVLAMGSMSVTVFYFVGRDLRTRPVQEES